MRVQLVDCRWELGRPERGRELYLAGHIPGASFLAVEQDLSGSEGGGRHPLPTAAEFARVAGAAGIGAGVLVVAYDQGMTGGAARLWWLLRHFGHDGAGVLARGLAAWLGPLERGEADVEPAEFTPRARTDDTVEADELLGRLGSDGLVLVDARVPERFRGEVEPIDPVAGHIPGALNRPFDRPGPDLPEGEEVVVYCGSGITACVVLHELVRSGREDAKLYPGSWSDWSTRGLPAERG